MQSCPPLPQTMQVASMPLGLVSTQAQLISHSTHSAKLPFFHFFFFSESCGSCFDCQIRMYDYEKWREGAYARDKLNI